MRRWLPLLTVLFLAAVALFAWRLWSSTCATRRWR
jgi:hypothetical protein